MNPIPQKSPKDTPPDFLVVSIDPGEHIGLTTIDNHLTVVASEMFLSPTAAVRWLSSWPIYCLDNSIPDLHYVFEDFIGSGRRNDPIKATLMVLGYLYYYIQDHIANTLRYPRMHVVLQVPDRRKKYLPLARTMTSGTVHEKAALGHALARADDLGVEVPWDDRSLIGGY